VDVRHGLHCSFWPKPSLQNFDHDPDVHDVVSANVEILSPMQVLVLNGNAGKGGHTSLAQGADETIDPKQPTHRTVPVNSVARRTDGRDQMRVRCSGSSHGPSLGKISCHSSLAKHMFSGF
jgi:hypothetical protein